MRRGQASQIFWPRTAPEKAGAVKLTAHDYIEVN